MSEVSGRGFDSLRFHAEYRPAMGTAPALAYGKE